MEISTTTQGDVTVISVHGRLDSKSAPGVQHYLEEAIDEHRRIVIDLSQLSSLSSAGLRVLLLAHRQAEQTGASLTLAEVGPENREVLVATGFSTFFAMADTVADGVKALVA